MEPPVAFPSIAPLSERIRKKVEPPLVQKCQLNFEAAIIESSMSLDAAESLKNGEDKSLLSTALRELLEAKLEEEPSVETKDTDVDFKSSTHDEKMEMEENIEMEDEQNSKISSEESPCQEPLPSPTKMNPVKELSPKTLTKLKDPRTAVPKDVPAQSPKQEVTPVKRKVSRNKKI